MRRGARRVSGRARPDRRDLPADASAGRLLRRGPQRGAPAVQFPPDRWASGSARRSSTPDPRRTRRCCRRAAGRTGCSATTTSTRIASRVGPAQARVAAMLLLTLRGTPTLYYGDEIGMDERADPARARAGPVGAQRRRASVSVAIRSARRCNGTPRANCRLHDRRRPGCRSARTTRARNVGRRSGEPRLDADALPGR